MNAFERLSAQWVWLDQQEAIVNQYVDFRHEFIINDSVTESDDNGYLNISIDTEYALWVNGIFVDSGQYDDYPAHKSYDRLDLREYLVPGKNSLCISGYYQGKDSFQYITGTPRLIYAMQIGDCRIASGENTRCRQSMTYACGPMEEITPQLSFSFRYDASSYDGWLAPQYVPGAVWMKPRAVRAAKDEPSVYIRPNRKLIAGPDTQGEITACGYFIRQTDCQRNDPDEFTSAEWMQTDYLSSRPCSQVFDFASDSCLTVPSDGLRIKVPPSGNTGIYLLIDLQREEVGFFSLSLNAHTGVCIDAAYGEHLDDLRVRARIGNRNFAFRYRCGDGDQTFVHYHKKIAGRYIQLHITGIREELTLYYAGICPAAYPVEHKGVFTCGDRLFHRIHEVSRRTLELNMLEHYTDTPWREQGFYAMDSRNQALCGYYCFGEYDYPQSAFELFAESLGDDGMFEICAPARYGKTIPCFGLAWILAIRDLVLYSGRIDTAAELWPIIHRMMDTYQSLMTGYLLKTPTGTRYWNFYEWTEGLDGSVNGTYDAPLNLFFHLALTAAAQLARWTAHFREEEEYNTCAHALAGAVNETFWDDRRKAYQSFSGEHCTAHYAELTQALALCCGIVLKEEAAPLRKQMADKGNKLVKTMLSYRLYKYEALLQEPKLYAKMVFDEIGSDWGYMLYHNATSFWETLKGADDFGKAGSLSHGWSAIPAYFFYAYLLGIKPIEPGFGKYSFEPVRQVVSRASGFVPTPKGGIVVRWYDNGQKIEPDISEITSKEKTLNIIQRLQS